MKVSKDESAQAIKALREILSPGATVYTSLRHVSRSGIQREISLHAIEDGELRWLTGYASKALGERIGKRDGLVVGGCGMDMGFHVVYNLGRVLFPEGFKVEGRGRNGDTSGWDEDGGYALKHRWI